MRPGFSEDGIACALPKGNYQLSLEPTQDSKLRGFSLILAGEIPDTERDNGTFSTDMACVGVLDRQTFLKHFAGNGEALFDWSADALGKKESQWGGFLKHKQSGLEAFYVKTGADGRCAVQLLCLHSCPVGIRVIPNVSPERPTDQRGSRHWTWVELKCEGIGEPWSFCDDRDFEPDFDQTLEDVLSEVNCLCSGDSDSKVGPDVPISRCSRRYKGISKVTTFYERAGEPRRRIHFPPSHTVPKLGPNETARKIAKAVFDLFKSARRLA